MSNSPHTPRIDLFVWTKRGATTSLNWNLGDVTRLPTSERQVSAYLQDSIKTSTADYLLLWAEGRTLPTEETLFRLAASGADLMHAGLRMGLGSLFSDLNLIIQNWSMLNAPSDQPSTSWRLSLDACLVRRDILDCLGGIDAAFLSRQGAGMELGYRALKMGAVIEYQPELCVMRQQTAADPPSQDLYTFVLRHYGARWAQYLLLRRSLKHLWVSERRALRRAKESCAASPARGVDGSPVWSGSILTDRESLTQTPVSVIVPTLGRYAYLPEALDSMRRQTVRPSEVIVVDQNPQELRQPQVYEGYEDLNLQVIWQDGRGQSLARNTGLAAANCPYVFLFDDDSIAHDDLIESHLRFLADGRFQVSTGVAYPPPPEEYKKPPGFRYPRVAQTFDTGNSLLPLALARQLGGLDRNYDFGPGTDTDFGTRLYLAGYRILHNPEAARIHFKAPIGGLRTYGAHKYNTDTGLLDAFPPITQSYYGLRYLSRSQQRERLLIQFATSKFPRGLDTDEFRKMRNLVNAVRMGLGLLLLPFKWNRSLKGAQALIREGRRLGLLEMAPHNE